MSSQIPPAIVEFSGDIKVDKDFDRPLVRVNGPVKLSTVAISSQLFVNSESESASSNSSRPSTALLKFNSLEFKIIITGDKCTGKTTFIKNNKFLSRFLGGKFEKKYELTTGIEVYWLNIPTNSGNIRFECWVTAGGEKLRDDFYDGSQCAIIMFDVTTRSTYENVSTRLSHIRRVCKDIPIVLCGNKVDLKNRQVKAEEVTSQWKNRVHELCGNKADGQVRAKKVTSHWKKDLPDLPYYEISAKSNYNLDKPFLYLTRALTGDPNLQFVESPASPEVHIDSAAQQRHEAGPSCAAGQSLPDNNPILMAS